VYTLLAETRGGNREVVAVVGTLSPVAAFTFRSSDDQKLPPENNVMHCTRGSVLSALLVPILASATFADENPPPPFRTFASADGSTLFRVTSPATPEGPAVGRVFRVGNSGAEQVLWETTLVNVPDRAFVSARGQVATVESRRHQWGDHAVVVYGSDGERKADIPLFDVISFEDSLDWHALRASAKGWSDSWTGRCRFEVDDERQEFLVTAPSQRVRRVSLIDGRVRLGRAGVALEPPRITLKGDPQAGLVFDVLNPNDEPKYYTGYTRASFSPPIPAGEMRPLCRVEVQRQAGGPWEDATPGYCGTGLGEVFIPARAT
jgi:hypothetical protein